MFRPYVWLAVVGVIILIIIHVSFGYDTSGPLVISCAADSQCALGEYCDDGQCKQFVPPIIVECNIDNDCQDDEMCVRNKCVPPLKILCSSDANCPSGTTCNSSGQCVPQMPPLKLLCSSDANCPSGTICDSSGQCVPQMPPLKLLCSSDANCPSGTICDSSGQCVPQMGPLKILCSSDANCPSGTICDSSGKCVPPSSTVSTIASITWDNSVKKLTVQLSTVNKNNPPVLGMYAQITSAGVYPGLSHLQFKIASITGMKVSSAAGALVNFPTNKPIPATFWHAINPSNSGIQFIADNSNPITIQAPTAIANITTKQMSFVTSSPLTKNIVGKQFMLRQNDLLSILYTIAWVDLTTPGTSTIYSIIGEYNTGSEYGPARTFHWSNVQATICDKNSGKCIPPDSTYSTFHSIVWDSDRKQLTIPMSTINKNNIPKVGMYAQILSAGIIHPTLSQFQFKIAEIDDNGMTISSAKGALVNFPTNKPIPAFRVTPINPADSSIQFVAPNSGPITIPISTATAVVATKQIKFVTSSPLTKNIIGGQFVLKASGSDSSPYTIAWLDKSIPGTTTIYSPVGSYTYGFALHWTNITAVITT